MSEHLFLGFDALGRPIRLTPEERLSHMYAIGSSGSGKSKFLEWMIRGDLMNRQGFCLIDPHGTLYDEIASYCAHHVLKRDIILLNLSDPQSVISFNPFQRAPKGDISVQVDQRITATIHAWNDRNTDEHPTLARMLRLIYTVMIEQNLTLPQAKYLIDFEQKQIRTHLVERLSSPLIQQEWKELLQLKRKEWRDEILSTKNRLYRFLNSETLCRFMGIPGRSLNLQEIMDEGKILLVNLRRSDYLSAENARVFGALLLNEFFEAAFRRQKDAYGSDPKPYYLYLDEFQNFVSLDIADMLDQVRKFGLYMVLAHQRFGQIDENVLEATLSHCWIKAVFGGLTVPNAKCMAEELFIGKLDPQRVKTAIYQTKFWPQYQRDKVYTKGKTHASAHGTGRHSASGFGSGSAAGEFFGPGDWFNPREVVGESEVATSFKSQISGESSIDTETNAEQESEADIPMFWPVPFKELSSIQHYSPEEQLNELTAALKEQFQRHCFIKIHQKDTQPMLVPFVEQFYTPRKNAAWYEQKLLAKENALPAAEVDRLLEARDASLLKELTSKQGSPSKKTNNLALNTDLPHDFRE